MKKQKPAIGFTAVINVAYPLEYYVAMIFGLFFLLVSTQKFFDPHIFATTVFRGYIMPYPLVNIAALLFMSLEFVAAIAVVFMPKFRRAGLWILVAVLLVYTGCAGINLMRGLNTVCGCFGSGARMAALSHWTLIRNLSLIVAGLFSLR